MHTVFDLSKTSLLIDSGSGEHAEPPGCLGLLLGLRLGTAHAHDAAQSRQPELSVDRSAALPDHHDAEAVRAGDLVAAVAVVGALLAVLGAGGARSSARAALAAEPGAMMQGEPEQQSAVVVHAPSTGTQLSPQMNGGSPPGLGAQGRLQQSALVAQASPT
jgi:hypothetical protein